MCLLKRVFINRERYDENLFLVYVNRHAYDNVFGEDVEGKENCLVTAFSFHPGFSPISGRDGIIGLSITGIKGSVGFMEAIGLDFSFYVS